MHVIYLDGKIFNNVSAPKMMTWHFSGFIFIELALNHEMIEEHCISIDDLASINDPQHLYNVLLSAHLQRLSSSIDSSNYVINENIQKRAPKLTPVEHMGAAKFATDSYDSQLTTEEITLMESHQCDRSLRYS